MLKHHSLQDSQWTWTRLDNAAKIYPPSSNSTAHYTNVFRFACELYEPIDAIILQSATERALKQFPLFRSIMRRGFFWYYLEESKLLPTVHIEDRPLCSRLFNPNIKQLLFDVSYWNNRINLEIFHALSDGTGALLFLQCIVEQYLIEKYTLSPETSVVPHASFSEKGEDSFSKYYQPTSAFKMNTQKKTPAFKLKGAFWPESRIEVIEGELSVQELRQKSKALGVTITVYLLTQLIIATYNIMSVNERSKPIIIALPVNLRNFFESSTTRNFFTLIYISYTFHDNPPAFLDVLQSVQAQLNQETEKEYLAERINQLVSIEHTFVKAFPLFIKKPALQFIRHRSLQELTLTFSNIGKINTPAYMKDYIRCFDIFNSTPGTQLCACSYKDCFKLSFSTVFSSLELEKHFFRQLTNDGLTVTIDTSVHS